MYDALDRFGHLSYSGKIMLVAFAGTHVPLIGLVAHFAATTAPDTGYALRMVGVALVATLVGTGITLFVLHHLLRPIVLTSCGLHRYIADRTLPALPLGYRDTAGMLMSDASYALQRLDETIDHLEHYDPVTALPNRASFLRRLAERAERADEAPFAVCVTRIERLDDIVSTFGQERGDSVLRVAVRRFESVLEHRGRLSRIDARTFALVLESDEPERIGRALESLGRSIEHIVHAGADARLDCRSGIALCPVDGREPESLLDGATNALDVAARERARFAFFSVTSREALIERHALERDLRAALGNDDELMLHYQPVIDASSDTIIGAEALIRWRHPTRGMVSPGSFIPLAEESDLIEDIGRWTLRTACRQLVVWRERGIDELKVAVNLSARQFNDPTLLTYLRETLEELAIEPGTLEIELTETSAMNDAARTSDIMGEVRDLGVSIAIDDFGTGYSSMSYLRTMPFNKLKIDREFVQDVCTNADRQAICRALIALARELKLEVLAEGTETSAEVETLRSQGCDVFQGFYFHRPMPAAEFEALFSGEAKSLGAARAA